MVKMSLQYSNNRNGNGKDKLNYSILKELYSFYGSNIFHNGNDSKIIEIIMNHTFTEEEKIRAKEAGDGYEIAMFSAKLSLADQKKIVLKVLFESIKHDSSKNGKTIETLLDEKITGQLALF